MRRWIFGVAVLAASALAATTASATTSGEQALASFSAAWAKVNSYTCTITAHEVLETKVQDRVYTMSFVKPSDTRMDITGGDGKGSAVVWLGGTTVKGHQGGFLSFIKLNLDMHDPKATSIRGTTVAEANFGAIIDHIKGLSGATIDAVADGSKTDVNVAVGDASANGNVTKEELILGANELPLEYYQWEGDNQVKHVVYSDIVLNPTIPDSTFQL
jgi:outer membrane lipoprotein-sorting protein